MDATPERDGDGTVPRSTTDAARPGRHAGHWLVGLFPLAFLGHLVVQVVFGAEGRAWFQERACATSGCTGPAMTVVGWLLIALPFLLVVPYIAYWSRLNPPARAAGLVVVVPLAVAGLLFVPGRGSSLDELVDGPGSDALATGITWAGVGIAVGVLALLVVSVIAARRRAVLPKLWSTLTTIGACVAMLGVALGRVAPVPVTAAQALPERTFTAAGDTLTRTAARDQPGCAGVLPDEGLLDGCLRTVEGTWTTDDSDAVVHLAAVFFPSESMARDRRAGLPDDVAQTGVTGDVLTVESVSGSWVLFSSVGHADGRTIAEADRGWLLWSSGQVAYRFIGHQVGFLVAPSPKNGIGPRTP
ncbi:hypothetical protein GA0070614_1813 [Micromonospora coxensis]|uniref:Uncharacterized protein n=1 Tax=Micromonospora coxensis TaxID=356852 RepID=A0A1C5HUK5_9ACTN|nr:hypothetical protein GA0070614_1813 [Micromonospora coxensis]